MKFYNRKKELALLKATTTLAAKVGGQFTIVMGRRRVGKSELIKKTFRTKSLYFFVSKKKSHVLLQEFGNYFNKISQDNRTYVSWDELIEQLFKHSIQTKITLIFDEFQNFKFVDQSIFDIFQKHWDHYQHEKNLNLIVAGSLISLLEKLFYDSKQPLYKRATQRIILDEFSFKTVYQILKDHQDKSVSLKDLLYFYTIFGGNPYYYNQIYKNDLFNYPISEIIEKLILNKNAVLQNEGREILIQEFGSEHATYFAILEAVASNQTTFTKIKHFINSSNGITVRSLKDLTGKFKLIKKLKPVYPNNRKTSRYQIAHHFTSFWFKYVYANQSFIENEKTQKILREITRDLNTLAGKTFEKLCLEFILTQADQGSFEFEIDKFGQWWDKTGEIDLVLGSKKENKVIFGEAKLNHKNITQKQLDKMIVISKKINAVQTRNKKYSFFCAQTVKQSIKNNFAKDKVTVYDESDFLSFLIS